MMGRRGLQAKERRFKGLLLALGLILLVSTFNSWWDQIAFGADPDPAREKKSKFQKSRLTRDETEETADRRELLLTTGEDKAVDLNFEANGTANGISVGNPQIISTTLVKVGDAHQIIFKPLKAGETTVSVRDAEGSLRLIFEVRVTGSNLLRVAGDLRRLLRDIEGIDIQVVGEKIVIEGEVLVPSDYGRLLTVITDKSYADLVMNLTRLSPLALEVLAKKIQENLNSFLPPEAVKTRVVNGVIFLEGTVKTKDEADRAGKVAALYLPETRPGDFLERHEQNFPVQKISKPLLQNFIMIVPDKEKGKAGEKMVRVTVHFVELSKDYQRLFGFKWQPGFQSDPTITFGNGGAGGFNAMGSISSLFPKLQSAQEAGYARVLKTGTVVVRSGQPAKMNETMDVPYQSMGQNGQVGSSVAKVGFVVALTPLILGQTDDIQMDLVLRQSSAVGEIKAGTAPLMSNHEVETKVFVKAGDSAAVAGINSSDIGTTFNKHDPNSGTFESSGDSKSNPSALFTMLRSKAYRKKKSQFVIFVTPEIVENASDGTEDLKRNFRVKVK